MVPMQMATSIERRVLDRLIPYACNVRTRSNEQVPGWRRRNPEVSSNQTSYSMRR
jgi:hypothetical protein